MVDFFFHESDISGSKKSWPVPIWTRTRAFVCAFAFVNKGEDDMNDSSDR